MDEVYVVAGHKGNPEAVKKRSGRKRIKLRGARGRGTLEKEKPSIFGMVQRGGAVVLKMFENVQQKTVKPIIEKYVKKGSDVNTDEHDIYACLEEWGYNHKTVCRSKGEYARDEDDVHSLLRPMLKTA